MYNLIKYLHQSIINIIKYLVILLLFLFILINQSTYVQSLNQQIAINDLLSSNCLFYGCECIYNQIKCPFSNKSSSSSSSSKLIMFPKRHFLSNYISFRIDLDLSENLLQSVPDDRLAYLNINKLNLSLNRLSRLSPDMFRDITHLSSLDLSHNKLDYLSMDIFKPIRMSLLELMFKHNYLNSMETIRLSSILTDLKRLQTLDLAHNSLVHMPNLIELTTLKHLDLSFNDLEYLTDSDTNQKMLPNSLLKLNLEHNQLKHLNENSFGLLTRLEYLNLANNQISEIAEDTFIHLTNLIEIDLSFNNFKHIPSRIFFTLINLSRLDLSAQRLPIQSIGNYAFDRRSNRKQISLIDLSLNQIELISSRAFCSKTSINRYVNIREINLTMNSITSLDVCVLRQLAIGNQLNRVMIRVNSTHSGNFECKCDMTRLVEIDICTNCSDYLLNSVDAYCAALTQFECFNEQKATKPFLIYLKQPTGFNITQTSINYTNRLSIHNTQHHSISYNLNLINSSLNSTSYLNASDSIKWSINLNVLIACLFIIVCSVK